MVFIIDEKPHPDFRRDGNDLVYKVVLPLVNALCGATIQVPHVSGRQLSVSIDRPVSHGDRHIVPGEGMPISKSSGQHGNLILEISVRFPRALSQEQKETLRAILPSR